MTEKSLTDSTRQFLTDHFLDIKNTVKDTSNSINDLRIDFVELKTDVKYIGKKLDDHDNDIDNLYSMTSKKTPKSISPPKDLKILNGFKYKTLVAAVMGALLGAATVGFLFAKTIF